MADSQESYSLKRRPVERIRKSCSECRRRKQKCDQQQPCNQCSRRFPTPACVYTSNKKSRPCPEIDLPVWVAKRSAVRLNECSPDGQLPSFFKPKNSILDAASSLEEQHNALLQMYLELHTQHTSSLQSGPGKSTPYQDIVVPMCAQSPLLSEIAVYLAASFFAEATDLEGTRMMVMTSKGRAIHKLNEALSNPVTSTTDEAMVGVVLIVNNELCYGETQYIPAHIYGLRDMVRLRGGLDALGMNGLLGKMAVVSDLITAIAFERKPIIPNWERFQGPEGSGEASGMEMNSPFMDSMPAFGLCGEELGLDPTICSILDDMRLLTGLIKDNLGQTTSWKAQKLKSTTEWVQSRILALPVDRHDKGRKGSQEREVVMAGSTPPSGEPVPDEGSDDVYKTIRCASLLFCRALIERKGLGTVTQTQDLLSLWGTMWRVPLHTWRRILGVFFWLQIVTAPAARRMPKGVFAKTMLPICALQMAQENWTAAKCALGTGLMVQEWLGHIEGTPVAAQPRQHGGRGTSSR